MRKLITLILVCLLLVPVFFLSPKAVNADRGDSDMCHDEHERCRARALQGDYGVVKTTLILSACDVALGTCLVSHAL